VLKFPCAAAHGENSFQEANIVAAMQKPRKSSFTRNGSFIEKYPLNNQL
jgi:hypothetical protein